MAHAARSEVAPIGLRVGRVTTVAIVVSGQAHRNCHRRAAPQGCAVTGGATILWPRRARHVLRVIELHVEAFFESIGKRLAWWIVAIHTRMANRAHRNSRRSELSHMTAGAIFMTRKTRPRRVVSAMMTIPAGD